MFMYLFTFIILALASLWCLFKGNSKVLLVFLTAWLILHDGLRWNCGTDWYPYLEYYNNCLTEERDFEIGYVVLNKIIYTISGGNYTVFLLFFAAFEYIVFYRFFKHYSPIPALSLLVLYSTLLPLMGMNRQTIALMICLISVKFIINRQFIPWLLMVLLAMMFHVTAGMFLISYFLNRDIPLKAVVVLFCIALVLAFSGVMNLVPANIFNAFGDHISSRGEAYMNMDQKLISSAVTTFFGLAKRMIWIVLLLILKKQLVKYRHFNLFFNLLFIGTLIYTICSGTSFQFIVGRGTVYFTIFQVVLIPMIFIAIKNWDYRLLLLFFVIGLSWFSLDRGINNYPNEVFHPYKSVLMNQNQDYV